jgi:signal transduction histidine kinase
VTTSVDGVSRSADDNRPGTPYGADMRPRLDPARVDRVGAVVLVVAVEVQIFLSAPVRPSTLSAAVVFGIVAASLGVRRAWPILVGIGVQALMVGQGLLGEVLPGGPFSPVGPPVVAVAWFSALYALAVWTPFPWFLAGLVFFGVSDLAPFDPPSLHAAGAFTAGVLAIMVFLRSIVGRRDRQLRIAERERDLGRREAVVEERARIARELHDVIAHHVSMMVVQAGAERRVLDPAQASTREVLGTIEQVGRSALTEMRRLVGMLRGDDRVGLLPQPALADVPTLVAQLRDAGLPVEFTVDGEPRELPVGIELSAYRVIQEGLTNALKHAGRASAAVRIRYGARSLELEIVDDGGGETVDVPSGGHGLVGIRERVALYGGELEAGRRADGGFVLRVLLPTA